MSHITLNIVADSAADLADTLNGIVATLLASTATPALTVETAAPAVAEAPKAESKPRGRKPAEPKVEDAAPVEAAKVEEPAPAADTPALTYADVQAAVTKLAAKKGRDAVIAVFEQFGVDHGSKLTETQWPEAIAALGDALDAEALA